MSREEFIGRAVEAHIEAQRLGRSAQAGDRVIVRPLVEAALDAVGAWGLRVTLETVRELHGPTYSGAYCRVCDEMNEPDYPCSTHRAATLGLAR